MYNDALTDPVQKPRLICWFSCGAASAVNAKIALNDFGSSFNVEVVHCDTLAPEHPDNARFKAQVEDWLGVKIITLHSEHYTMPVQVFRARKFIFAPNEGAPCSTELKKMPRLAYQRDNDTHAFGFTIEESNRIVDFTANNPELKLCWPLTFRGYSKQDCFRCLQRAGIKLPALYLLGYQNNNCIGCVKGGMGYWNKIRVDFPEKFAEMAALERELGFAMLTDRRGGKRVPLFLDQLKPGTGRYASEPPISCGPACGL